MRRFLVSALALGVLASTAAPAEPVRLTGVEMDGITASAGFIGIVRFGTPVRGFRSTPIPPLVNTFGGPVRGFRSTPIPPLVNTFDRFVSPNRAFIVLGDDDIIRFRIRRDVRFTAPFRRHFGEMPVKTIVVNKNIFVLGGNLDD